MLYRYNENPDLEQLQIGDDLEVRLEDLNVEDSNTLSEKLEQVIERLGDEVAMLTVVDSWGVRPSRTLCTFKFRYKTDSGIGPATLVSPANIEKPFITITKRTLCQKN